MQRRRIGIAVRRALAGAALAVVCSRAEAATAVTALRDALQGTQASAVVLDLRSGKVLTAGKERRGTPGSAIKPLLLAFALNHGYVLPETEVYCRRDLHIAGRALLCTHPADRTVFTAESALAESCNTWFAELGKRLSGPVLEAALESTRLPHAAMNAANEEQRELAVLGLSGVTASPLELARAYRAMLQEAPGDGPVVRGLRGSVEYGMAHLAAVPGLALLGKTGTAANPGETSTHGWFAGAVPGRVLLVVYVPRGDGGTAALIGRVFFREISAGERAR